jgi:starch phosphorylase
MLTSLKNTKVAYFSMEIALENDLKTYAGGLGVLAGDLLRAAASLKFPMVGICLLNPQGYLKQKISFFNNQISKPDGDFNISKLKKLKTSTDIYIGREKVKIGVWQYFIKNINGFKIPIYFLDTNLEENSLEMRKISGRLYGGDRIYRLKQEIVLGRGGVKMLQALGYNKVSKIHLNEGHGSLAGLELLLQSKQKSFQARIEEVRRRCVFTTHTSIPNSQEVFTLTDFLKYQPDFPLGLKDIIKNDLINFTFLGFYFSSYVNAVSKKHREIVAKLYPDFIVNSNTNGIDSGFWAAEEYKKMYDKYIPLWRKDYSLLSKVNLIPKDEISLVHQKTKLKLLSYIKSTTTAKFKEEVFTIGYARRFTAYKRPDLLFRDLKSLIKISNEVGKIQIVFSGKAHANDSEGQKMIKFILNTKNKLRGKIEIAFIENYDLDKAKLLVAGVDLWLNTPLLYNEASGTSGMKAAIHGIPQLSTLDGWWLEGYKKDQTGWAIIEKNECTENNLYELLAKKIIPLFYKKPDKWLNIMQSTIALNASYFNSQRNLKQYIKEAYKINN